MDSEIETPVFDRDAFMARVMGDQNLASIVLTEYIKSLPDDLSTLKKILQEANGEELKQVAHGMKGASANVGAMVLRDTALQLEKAGLAHNFSEANSLLKQLEKEHGRFEKAIKDSGILKLD